MAVPRVAAQHAGDPQAAVQALLDRRAVAVAAGDRDAWTATVDPEAPESFREAQGRTFDGLRSLPLEGYRLLARTDDTGDLGPGVADRYDGARVFLPETRQVYRFTGYDDRDAVDTLWWTYVERAGRWYLAADGDLSHLGLDSTRNLWELGPVRVHRSPHFLVISPPEQAERADDLARIGEDAMAALGAHWDRPWAGRIPMILPGSIEQLEILLQSTFDLDSFVAFVVYSTVRDSAYEATAPRIYVQDRNLSRYGRTFQVQTLVHELVHAASAPISGPAIPAWVHEGVADWVAAGRPVRERPPAGSDGVLPRDHEFSTGGVPSIVRAYDESRSAMAHLAGARGRAAPVELFATLGGAVAVPGSVDHLVSEALSRVAGEGLDAFQRNWAGARAGRR